MNLLKREEFEAFYHRVALNCSDENKGMMGEDRISHMKAFLFQKILPSPFSNQSVPLHFSILIFTSQVSSCYFEVKGSNFEKVFLGGLSEMCWG